MDIFITALTVFYTPHETGYLIFVILPVFAGLFIFEVLSFKKLFPKLGIATDHIYVPLFNTCRLYRKMLGGPAAIAYVISALAFVVTYAFPGRLMNIVCFLVFLIYIGITVAAKIKLAYSLGKNVSYMIGLIFVEEIFYYILANDDSTYKEGKIDWSRPARYLKRYAGKRNFSRRYMIDLQGRRSLVALIAGTFGFLFSFYGISIGLMNTYLELMNDSSYSLFHFFTVNSNVFSAVGSAFMIPYAIDGIRRKRFVLPKWISLFQFSGAFCLGLTMSFAILFIFPTTGAYYAFGGANFWLHIVCPIMAIVLLFTVETDRNISLDEMILCMLPYFVYSLIYTINVVLIGEEHGGWKDIYMIAEFLKPTTSSALMYLYGFAVATVIRLSYNRIARIRLQKLMQGFDPDATPVEINIEVYGLGRYNGKHMDAENITIPIDIFNLLAGYYDMEVDKLTTIYNKGVIDGLKEKQKIT